MKATTASYQAETAFKRPLNVSTLVQELSQLPLVGLAFLESVLQLNKALLLVFKLSRIEDLWKAAGPVPCLDNEWPDKGRKCMDYACRSRHRSSNQNVKI